MNNQVENSSRKHGGRLLCLSYRFPPQTYALAIRVKYFLNHLAEQGWEIDALTAASDAPSRENITVHRVPAWTPERILDFLRKLRLGKLIDLLVWPDPYVFWALPAYLKACEHLRANQYDAIAVFMMPYSVGLVGLLLRRETDLPILFNFNDSPTCSDMNPTYPSRFHYWLAKELEDGLVQLGDAAIYVSRRNLKRVRSRQPPKHRDKFHLIRRGAPSIPDRPCSASKDAVFNINYIGGTGGWYKFLQNDHSLSALRRLYQAWNRLGTYSHADLDYRTHGPIYLGQAVEEVLATRPEWQGRLQINVYGKRFPSSVTDAVLDKFGLQDIVTLHGHVPHERALQKMTESDLLFMALPDRTDGSAGGRISAKTYEYLSTDRPILAALPPGENREYLQDKPGVYFTDPADQSKMTAVIREVVEAKFNGDPISIDRSDVRPALHYSTRAREFEDVLSALIGDPT